MGNSQFCPEQDLHPVGNGILGSLHLAGEQETHSLLLQSSSGPRFQERCSSANLDGPPQICLPSHPINTRSPAKDLSQQGLHHPHCTQLAKTGLVLRLPVNFNPFTSDYFLIYWCNTMVQPVTPTKDSNNSIPGIWKGVSHKALMFSSDPHPKQEGFYQEIFFG